jgi:hypothetical protein
MVEKVFILPNCGDENPYHLFFYMFGQLRCIDNGPILYYYPPSKSKLCESALANLPARFKRKTEITDDCICVESTFTFIKEIVKADEQWIFHYVRDLYKHIYESFKEVKGKYSYISRKKAAIRRITNEAEYLDSLTSIGVDVYCMEDLDFVEQIRVFRESEIITGPHGAAMSFLIFCEPGTIVFEIYKADSIKCHYTSLATVCSLKYMRYDDVDEFNEITHDFKINSQGYLEMLKGLIDFSSFGSS